MTRGQLTQRIETIEASAETLIDALLEARLDSERRLKEFGRSDAIKQVTGRSSLDIALDQTRAILCRAQDAAQLADLIAEIDVARVSRQARGHEEHLAGVLRT